MGRPGGRIPARADDSGLPCFSNELFQPAPCLGPFYRGAPDVPTRVECGECVSPFSGGVAFLKKHHGRYAGAPAPRLQTVEYYMGYCPSLIVRLPCSLSYERSSD
jgi:hypothetical protein